MVGTFPLERAQQVAEDRGLGRWARHKARGELRDADARFGSAMQTWRAVGEPEAQLLEARRRQVGPEVARLEQAQHAREAFLADHPDVPGRISELNRAIEARERLENMPPLPAPPRAGTGPAVPAGPRAPAGPGVWDRPVSPSSEPSGRVPLSWRALLGTRSSVIGSGQGPSAPPDPKILGP